VLWHCWLGGRKGIRPVKNGGWWRWALVSPDGLAPSRMVSVSASVNLPLHHEVQTFSSGTCSPGGPGKRAVKWLQCGGGLAVTCFLTFAVSIYFYMCKVLNFLKIWTEFSFIFSRTLFITGHVKLKFLGNFRTSGMPKFCPIYLLFWSYLCWEHPPKRTFGHNWTRPTVSRYWMQLEVLRPSGKITPRLMTSLTCYV